MVLSRGYYLLHISRIYPDSNPSHYKSHDPFSNPRPLYRTFIGPVEITFEEALFRNPLTCKSHDPVSSWGSETVS